MSYKSNDRVSGNRLSSFASQLWEKIKNTFASKNHSHDAVTTSASGFMSSTDKIKLDGIASNANNYSLPTASKTDLGGVKVGTNLSIDGNGVLSATDTKYTLTKEAVTNLGDLTNNTSGNAATSSSLDTKTVLLQGMSSAPWYNVVEIGAAFENYRDVTATIGIQLKLKNSSGIGDNYFCTANIGCRCNIGTEILSAFCIVDGTIDLSDIFDLRVTASYYNGNAMVKLFVHVKDTDSNNYYQVNFVTLCKDDFNYSVLYSDRSQSSIPTGTKTADAVWYDDITGNAATATKLTKGYGSETQPIYIKSDGTPEVCADGSISVENAKYATYASDVKSGSNLENKLNNFVTTDTSQTIYGSKTFAYTINGNIFGNAATATKALNSNSAEKATLADTANNAATNSFGVIHSGGSYNCLVVVNPANSSQSIQLLYDSHSDNGSRGIWDTVLDKYVIKVKNDGAKFNGVAESAEKWGGYALSLTYTTNPNFICFF